MYPTDEQNRIIKSYIHEPFLWKDIMFAYINFFSKEFYRNISKFSYLY